MIAQYWNDRSRYYTQTNNPTEEQLRKEDGQGWLETCGPTSAVNCLSALGYNLIIKCPGLYIPQPEEVLSDYLNDPANYPKLRKVRPNLDPVSIPGGRVPQYYPLAVFEVFGAKGEYIDNLSWSMLRGVLSIGSSVQICLKNPGHYLAVVHYDSASDSIVYNDSWPARVGGNGFNCKMNKTEFDSNVKPFAVVYSI